MRGIEERAGVRPRLRRSSGSLERKDMQSLVVDASVVVKWFVDEENSDKAIRIRDKYIDGD
jgi:hypothetical protein